MSAETLKPSIAEAKYIAVIDRLGALFGFDPVARTRMSAQQPRESQPHWLDALTGDHDEGWTGDWSV